ncbi:hypothetical protein Tsubulata_001470 [Turnera subulata]|uniref:Uncharacterized protein n=1 Tax=Turnera subulata TaxID=218843 RepID=A0A9Q0FDJ2_9ROSI|nr:hypothetical protein Tsubulata_001470 [Turnera subulata]
MVLRNLSCLTVTHLDQMVILLLFFPHHISPDIQGESTGTASVDDVGYGDPVQKAEAMAFRRACACFGLGLHLYHEDML